MFCYKQLDHNDDSDKSFVEILVTTFSNPFEELKTMFADLTHDREHCPSCRSQYLTNIGNGLLMEWVQKCLNILRCSYRIAASEQVSLIAPLCAGAYGLYTEGLYAALKNASTVLGALVIFGNTIRTARLMQYISDSFDKTTAFMSKMRRPICRLLLLFVVVCIAKKGYDVFSGLRTRSLYGSDITKLFAACCLSLIGVATCGKHISVVLSIISMVDLKSLLTKSFTEIYNIFTEVLTKICDHFGFCGTSQEMREAMNTWNQAMGGMNQRDFLQYTLRANELLTCKRARGACFGTPAFSDHVDKCLRDLDPLNPMLSTQQRDIVCGIIRSLTSMRRDNEWRISCGRNRCAPYGCLLIGAPGIGKTFCSNSLMRAFWSALKERAPEGIIEPSVQNLAANSNVIFTRNTAQEFYEGYVAQPVIFFSDLFKFWMSKDASAQQKQTMELAELQDLIDNSPYYPNFAALQSGQEPGKGMAISPNLVLGTTNYLYVDLRTDPHILGRRFKMVLLALLRNEHIRKTPSLNHLVFYRKRTEFGLNGPGARGQSNWTEKWTQDNQLPKTLAEFESWPWRHDFEEIKITDIVPQMLTEYLEECDAYLDMQQARNPFFAKGQTPLDVVDLGSKSSIEMYGRRFEKIHDEHVLVARSKNVPWICSIKENILTTPGTENNCLFYAIRMCLGQTTEKNAIQRMRNRSVDMLRGTKEPLQHGAMISDSQAKDIARLFGVQICMHRDGYRYLLDDDRDERRLIHIHFSSHHYSAIQDNFISPEKIEEKIAVLPTDDSTRANTPVTFPNDDEDDALMKSETEFETTNFENENEKKPVLPVDTTVESFHEVATSALESLFENDLSQYTLPTNRDVFLRCQFSEGNLENLETLEKALQIMNPKETVKPFLSIEKEVEGMCFGPLTPQDHPELFVASAVASLSRNSTVNICLLDHETLVNCWGTPQAQMKIVIAKNRLYLQAPPHLCSFFQCEPQKIQKFMQTHEVSFKSAEYIEKGLADGSYSFRCDPPTCVDDIAHFHGLTLDHFLGLTRRCIKTNMEGSKLVTGNGDPEVAQYCLMSWCAQHKIEPMKEVKGFWSRHMERVMACINRLKNPDFLLNYAVTGLMGVLLGSVFKLFQSNKSNNRNMITRSVTVAPSKFDAFMDAIRRMGGKLLGYTDATANIEYDQDQEHAFMEALKQARIRPGIEEEFEACREVAGLPRNFRKCCITRVFRLHNGVKIDEVNGLCLKGGIIVFPRHIVTDADVGDEILVNDKKYPLTEVIQKHFPECIDLCLVNRNNCFSGTIEPNMMATKDFARQFPRSGAQAFAIIFRNNGHTYVQSCRIDSIQESAQKVKSSRGRELRLTGFKVFGANVANGDCGSILVVGGRIVGFLTASWGNESLWTPICSVDVSDIIQRYGDIEQPFSEGLSVCSLGTFEPQRSERLGHQMPSFHPYKVDDLSTPPCNYERTEIANIVDPNVQWRPARCSHPAWLNCCKKFPKEPVGCLPKEVYEAAEAYKKLWDPGEKFFMMASWKSTCNGFMDEKMTYQILNPVDLSKSPGKPFTDNCENTFLPPELRQIHDKRTMYTYEDGRLVPHPVLCSMAGKILDSWKNGHCPRVPFSINLKHEVRSSEAYDAYKVRLFVAPPHHLNLAARRLLGRWAGEMKRNGRKLKHAIGINPHCTVQWENLRNHLRKNHRYALGPDFTAYDCSHWSELVMIAADVIASYYEPRYRQSILACVLSCSRFEFRDGKFHIANAGFSSGSQLTTQINCVFTALLYMAFGIWKYGSWEEAEKHFDFVCYGDDCLIGVEASDTNGFCDELVAFMKRCGYKLTAGDKDELTDVCPFSEVRFLKRKFEFSRGLLRAPLPLKQIFKPIIHYSEDVRDKDECGRSSLRAMALEIAELNATDKNEVLSKLREACQHPIWKKRYHDVSFDEFLNLCERMKYEAFYFYTDPDELARGTINSDGGCEWAH